MKSLQEFIKEQNKDIFEEYVFDKIRIALHCWQKTGFNYDLKYFVPKIFENYKYNFDNCSDVVKTIVEYLNNENNIKEHSYTFKFDNVFFKKLQISFTFNQHNAYIKTKSKKDLVYIQLKIRQNEIFDDYKNIYQRNLIYNIIHELTHAYEDYILRLEGKPSIISLMKGDYLKEYNLAVMNMRDWIDKPSTIRTLLAKCKYFLNEHEMIAYLANVKETIKNIFDKVKPKITDLKFNEILEIFSKEYIWKDYLKIYKFVSTIDEIDKNIISNKYYLIFGKHIDPVKLIDEIKEKWEIFEREFMEAFIEGYAESESELVFEHYIDFGVDYINNPYKYL